MAIITVTAPASDRSLVTTERVMSELDVSGFGVSDNDLIATWVKNCSDAVCEACNVAPDQLGRRSFITETLTIAYRVKELWTGYEDYYQRLVAMRPIVLPWRIPFVAISATLADPAYGVITLQPGIDFEVEPMSGLAYRIDSNGMRRAWERASITFTGTSGWAQGDVPATAQLAVINLVRLRWDARGRNSLLKAEHLAGESSEYWVGDRPGMAGMLPASVLDSLVRSGLASPLRG